MSYSLLSATLTDAYSALTEGDFVWILVGGGKIFIYRVDNIIKIRTNEEDYMALQD